MLEVVYSPCTAAVSTPCRRGTSNSTPGVCVTDGGTGVDDWVPAFMTSDAVPEPDQSNLATSRSMRCTLPDRAGEGAAAAVAWVATSSVPRTPGTNTFPGWTSMVLEPMTFAADREVSFHVPSTPWSATASRIWENSVSPTVPSKPTGVNAIRPSFPAVPSGAADP
jgi:hypothetical protein